MSSSKDVPGGAYILARLLGTKILFNIVQIGENISGEKELDDPFPLPVLEWLFFDESVHYP